MQIGLLNLMSDKAATTRDFACSLKRADSAVQLTAFYPQTGRVCK